MNIIGKVFMNIDFQENEVMPLLHGARQLYNRVAHSMYLYCVVCYHMITALLD